MRADADRSKRVRERIERLKGVIQESNSEPTGPRRVPFGPHRESTHSPPSAARARLARILGPPRPLDRRAPAEPGRKPGKALELLAPGLLFGTPHGETYVARRCPNRWPGDGRWAPEQLAERDGGALALMCGAGPTPEQRLDDPRRWLFVDTESIGLGGWAGNMAFVIGLGYFTKGGFQVEQIVVRNFEEEAAALWHLSKVAERFDAFVTFNGKCFDLPLLRHRCRFAGVDSGALDKAQLDLLGVSRRVFRERLLDCKLSTLEEEVLGLWRKQDIASADIPATFFDYLHRGCAEGIARVLRHNEQDLLSMVSLAGALLDAAEGRINPSSCSGITEGDHRRAALAQAKAYVRRALDAERSGEALKLAVAGAEAALRWAEVGDAPIDMRLRAMRRVGRIRRKVLRAELAAS